MDGFMQPSQNKRETAADEYTKSTIPRHESHRMRWVVCLISSGVLSLSHCHSLALFKLPGVPRAGWLWISDCEHVLAPQLPPVFALPKSTLKLDHHFKSRGWDCGWEKAGLGIRGPTWDYARLELSPEDMQRGEEVGIGREGRREHKR